MSSRSGRGEVAAGEPVTTIAELYARAQADVPALTVEVIALIRERVPEYATVTVSHQEQYTAGQLRGMITGLGFGRGPEPHELDAARELGRQRADDRVPLHALVSAYQVGYQRLWAQIQQLARDSGDVGLQLELLARVDDVWTWIQSVSAAASQAHSEATRVLEAVDIRSTQRFVQALGAGAAERDAAERAAAGLGYDPAGPFQVVVWSIGGWSEQQVRRWHEEERVPRRGLQNVHVADVGQVMVAVLQGGDPGVLVTRVRRVRAEGGVGVGVGLSRPGVQGAADSYQDALLCLGHAGPRREVVDFGRWWLPVSLSAHEDRLRQVLAPGVLAAGENPHLLETVLAFADAGSSLAATAAALHVHVNTVRYRLGRWRTLTGWDPATWDGLSRSVLVGWTRTDAHRAE